MKITAHRGASASAPENTIASIQRALEIGVDFIELDLQQTKDGKIILLHDPNFLRTSFRNLNVWDANYSDIKTLDVGSWFNASFSSETPPLLEDVFDLVRGKCQLNLEIKYNGRNNTLPLNAIKLVSKNNLINDVIVTSFSHQFIKIIQTNLPQLRTGYIFSFPFKPLVWLNSHPIASVNKIAMTNPIVTLLKKMKKEVHIWTLDEEREIQKALSNGVDNIITNKPDLVNKIINPNK